MFYMDKLYTGSYVLSDRTTVQPLVFYLSILQPVGYIISEYSLQAVAYNLRCFRPVRSICRSRSYTIPRTRHYRRAHAYQRRGVQ